jgi:proline iminopeptidase
MGDGGREKRLASVVVALLLSSCAPQVPPATIPPVVVPPRTPVLNTPAPVPVSRATEGEIDGGGGKLWFHIAGRGPDTVIVPLDAWLSRGLAALGERHTVVFYDPRHRGRSHALTDTTAASFDGDVADLEAVRVSIGASRVSVIGYDYYAGVAAAWAAQHAQSVSRVILLSPIEPADSLVRNWNPAERMARIDTTAARALVKSRAAGRDTSDAVGYCTEFWRVNARLFVGDTALAGRVGTDLCQLANETPARVADAAGRALSSLGPAVDIGASANGLSAPTLVMHGRLDLVANPEGAREWTRRIPGARLLWLSNVGHMPQLEAASVVIDAINDFLAGAWPPRAGPP